MSASPGGRHLIPSLRKQRPAWVTWWGFLFIPINIIQKERGREIVIEIV